MICSRLLGGLMIAAALLSRIVRKFKCAAKSFHFIKDFFILLRISHIPDVPIITPAVGVIHVNAPSKELGLKQLSTNNQEGNTATRLDRALISTSFE